MDIAQLTTGENPPDDINVVIEIPRNDGIKYEIDKASGALFVDRFLATPMVYPCNYGFIPGTLSDDGDATDALVVCPFALPPASVIRARPIAVLQMQDEAGQDEKILAVAHSKVTPLYDDVAQAEDLPPILLAQIRHFFEHYKDLENDKWVKMQQWEDAESARRMILRAVEQASRPS